MVIPNNKSHINFGGILTLWKHNCSALKEQNINKLYLKLTLCFVVTHEVSVLTAVAWPGTVKPRAEDLVFRRRCAEQEGQEKQGADWLLQGCFSHRADFSLQLTLPLGHCECPISARWPFKVGLIPWHLTMTPFSLVWVCRVQRRSSVHKSASMTHTPVHPKKIWLLMQHTKLCRSHH